MYQSDQEDTQRAYVLAPEPGAAQLPEQIVVATHVKEESAAVYTSQDELLVLSFETAWLEVETPVG